MHKLNQYLLTSPLAKHLLFLYCGIKNLVLLFTG